MLAEIRVQAKTLRYSPVLILLTLFSAYAQTNIPQQIQATVSAKTTPAKSDMVNLNTLKISLINQLKTEIGQLQAEENASGVSDITKQAIDEAIKKRQDESDSLNASLGAWTTGSNVAPSGVGPVPAAPKPPPVGSCSGAAGKGTAPMLVQASSGAAICAAAKSGTPATEVDPDIGACIAGKVSDSTAKEVRICVNDLEVKDSDGNASQQLTSATFGAKVSLKVGDKVVAQEVVTTAGVKTYGSLSNVVTVGKCSQAGTDAQGPPPTLDTMASAGDTVTGKLASPKGGTIRICVNDIAVVTAPVSSDGTFAAKLPTPVTQGQKVSAQQVMSDANAQPEKYGLASDPQALPEDASAYSWGRVRAYLTGGAILSEDQGQFSKSSIYLDFDTDSAWYMGDHSEDQGNSADGGKVPSLHGSNKPTKRSYKAGLQVNSLFNVRLTALPATSSCPGTGANAVSASCVAGNTAGTDSSIFVTTPKAALISAGVYLPMYLGRTSWTWDNHRHALYFAPIAKGGFQTLVQSTQNGSAVPTTIDGDTFFHFFEVGGRFGLFRFHDHAGNRLAPDQIMYLDVTGGQFQNFPSVDSTNTIKGYPWRLAMEGRFIVPKTPIFVGFNSNTFVGESRTDVRGDLRFLFGASIDVGCLMQKLGVGGTGVAGCDSSGSTTKPSDAAATSPPKQ